MRLSRFRSELELCPDYPRHVRYPMSHRPVSWLPTCLVDLWLAGTDNLLQKGSHSYPPCCQSLKLFTGAGFSSRLLRWHSLASWHNTTFDRALWRITQDEGYGGPPAAVRIRWPDVLYSYLLGIAINAFYCL